MALVEVDIGLGPALTPPHNSGHHGRSYGFIVMVITEVDIGIIPVNFLQITMVD